MMWFILGFVLSALVGGMSTLLVLSIIWDAVKQLLGIA